MFQLFIAGCKGSYLKLLSDCSLYKVKVLRRVEMELQEVDVPALLLMIRQLDLGQHGSDGAMVYIY